MTTDVERLVQKVDRAIDRAERNDIPPEVIEMVLQTRAQDMREKAGDEAPQE